MRKSSRRPVRRMTPTPERLRPPRRLATRQTWEATGRIERTIARKWIPYLSPAQLIDDARAALVPEWRVQGVYMGAHCRPARAHLTLEFGTDSGGVSTSIVVALKHSDVAGLVAHVLEAYTMGAMLLSVGSQPAAEPRRKGGAR